ncbi:DUF2339 domain-containing protein [Clostridium bowmanii]|uniref:DUF2339 domain-containing protein n=1 Tax=Clostridium bowmanii TaxID=132925 RepID=UPI001C0E59E5|nr:DUF2339 domain-containing protein [Clostridium bowmanii]MBU3189568.1 DUF2339 domain-containing protein [Clostridium bowmanii]MCA1073590.1 DUF2339 domain-containing protein [Clostridium bowmanii]
MKDIHEYLRLQDEINKEIHLILLDLETVDKSEKEVLYLENKQLLDKLKRSNSSVVDQTRNEFVLLKNRMDTLVNTNVSKKLGFNVEISNLFQIAGNLESKLINLETKIRENTVSQEPTNSALTESVPIVNNTTAKKKEGKGLKLGVGALNLVGIILILISLSTFGRYVYVNFMSKEIKGVTLFIIPTLILLAGELYFSKKNYKFSKGITALGISGLYTAVIINYLALDNLTGIAALTITAIITGGAIYLSYKKESNLLRIVTLIGAYICLVPIGVISMQQSYIIVIILVLINILNIYFPLQAIKNKDINIPFEFYTSMLALFSTVIIGMNFDENVQIVLLISIMVIYSVQFMLTCKDSESRLNSVGLLLYFLIYPMVTLGIYWNSNIWYAPLVAYCIIGIVILLRVKNSSKWTGYVGTILTCLAILIRINTRGEKYTAVTIFVSILVFITLLEWIKYKNYLLEFTLKGLVFISILSYLINIRKPITIIYLVLFASILYCCKELKNNLVIIVFKYFYLLTIAGWVLNHIMDIEVLNNLESFIVLSICVIYTIIINKVNILRHDKIKIMNYISLCFIALGCIISGLVGSTEFYLTTALIVYLLVFMFTKEYVDSKILRQNKVLIYALLSTYIVVRLSFIVDVMYEFKQLLLSTSLMLVALGSVFLGFKINNSKLRKYGLILSLITCAKLMLVDFYSFSFIIKTLVFMIVGIIALIISYTFSKLEKEYKNK